MTFPVYFKLAGFSIPAHGVFEAAGYLAGTQLFLRLRAKFPAMRYGTERGLWIIVACLLGAVVGSKTLALVESIHAYWPHRNDLVVLFGGKTIVGGLAGGWIGVEIAKRVMKIDQRSGDRFVFPILLGLAIGRIGCFLTGLPDHTYGIATSLPWGIDFGDGIRRHPTQLYEIVLCIVLAVTLLIRMKWPFQNGELFRLMMLGYFSWRFAVEFIKPRETYFGLSPIQMTSFVGAIASLSSLYRLWHEAPRAGPVGQVVSSR